jgi:voltage-gated sodium channel
MEVYPWAWAYFVSFVIIAAFVFFNLFVAVIIGEMQKLNEADMKQEIHEDSKKLDILLSEVKYLRQELNQIKKSKD